MSSRVRRRPGPPCARRSGGRAASTPARRPPDVRPLVAATGPWAALRRPREDRRRRRRRTTKRARGHRGQRRCARSPRGDRVRPAAAHRRVGHPRRSRRPARRRLGVDAAAMRRPAAMPRPPATGRRCRAAVDHAHLGDRRAARSHAAPRPPASTEDHQRTASTAPAAQGGPAARDGDPRRATGRSRPRRCGQRLAGGRRRLGVARVTGACPRRHRAPPVALAQQVEHLGPEHADVARAERHEMSPGRARSTRCPATADHDGSNDDLLGRQRHVRGHRLPGGPRDRVLPAGEHLEHDDLVGQAERLAELLRRTAPCGSSGAAWKATTSRPVADDGRARPRSVAAISVGWWA